MMHNNDSKLNLGSEHDEITDLSKRTEYFIQKATAVLDGREEDNLAELYKELLETADAIGLKLAELRSNLVKTPKQSIKAKLLYILDEVLGINSSVVNAIQLLLEKAHPEKDTISYFSEKLTHLYRLQSRIIKALIVNSAAKQDEVKTFLENFDEIEKAVSILLQIEDLLTEYRTRPSKKTENEIYQKFKEFDLVAGLSRDIRRLAFDGDQRDLKNTESILFSLRLAKHYLNKLNAPYRDFKALRDNWLKKALEASPDIKHIYTVPRNSNLQSLLDRSFGL